MCSPLFAGFCAPCWFMRLKSALCIWWWHGLLWQIHEEHACEKQLWGDFLNYRTTECFCLKGPWGISNPASCSGLSQLEQVAKDFVHLSSYKDGDANSLWATFSHHSKENNIFASSWNFPCSRLCSLPLVLLLFISEKSLTAFCNPVIKGLYTMRSLFHLFSS